MSPEQLTATVIALSLSLSIVCYHGSNMNFGRILTKWNQNTVKRGRSVKKVGLSRAAKKKQRKQQQRESLVDYHSLLCCKTGDCVRSEFSNGEVQQMREEFYSLETQVPQGEFILRNVQ
mmetsp:Transcript_10019/g.13080  ORF Transcript_10019/g.13080 Transcript_10019/m.13080 type:complete len:119 (+) Transcript_10019:91-447(+)